MSEFAIDQVIGARVSKLRKDRNLTLRSVADELGLTYQQVRKYETGANRLSASTLYRLSQILNVSPAFFFKGLDEAGAPDSNEGESPAATPFDEVLGRIPEEDVRQAMRSLLLALENQTA